MQHLQECVQSLFAQQTVNNLIIRVGVGNRVLFDLKRSSEERVLTERTLFDAASTTKILATTSLAMIAIDRGLLCIKDPISKFFSVPDDKKELTVWHLLTHTMGIGHKTVYGEGITYDNVATHILSIPSDVSIGTEVLYSCPGFILLGKILERVFGERLDTLFLKLVAEPLGMESACFLPNRKLDIVNANAQASAAGAVNDNNCRNLGGVCGNAGLFVDLADMTRYVGMLQAHGAPLFSGELFSKAVQDHTPGMSQARGLGYLYVDERYTQTGGLFPRGSIGHCGHTGQSVFVDPNSGFYVIILSDATASVMKKCGKVKYEEVMQMRQKIHAAIGEDLKK